MMLLAFSLWAASSPLTFKLAPSGVRPGTYTNAIVEYDAKGRAVSAANGRAMPWVNAMDYGPSGTGSTTDDTAELQAAIDAVPDGGSLYLPAGRYLVSSTLTVNKGISITGDGMQSVIYPAPWFPTNQDVLKFSAASTVTGVALERFAIYPHPGYSGEKPGRNAIAFDCSGSSGWSNVVIRSVYLEARNGAALKIDNSDGDAVTVNGLTVEDSILFGGISAVGVGNGFRALGNSIAYSSSGNSNSWTGITLSLITSASDALLSGNYVTAPGGISASGNGVRIMANALRDCGVTNTLATNKVWIGSGTNSDVRANTIEPLLSASTSYGINVSTGAVGTRIGPNAWDSVLWASAPTNKVINFGSGTVVEVDASTMTLVYVNNSNAIVTAPNFTSVPGTSEIYWGLVNSTGIIAQLYAHSVAPSRLSTNGAAIGSVLKFDGSDISFGTDNSGGSGSMLENGLNAFTNMANSADVRVAASGGSATLSLSNTTVSAGSYGPGLLSITADAKGRITSLGSTVNGSSLTTLNASALSSGTVDNARLDTDLGRIGVITSTSGDILYRDSTGWTNRAKGSDGKVLKLVGGFPDWSDDLTNGAAGGGGTTYSFTNGLTLTGTNVTAALLGAGGVTLTTNGSGVITITGTTVTNAPVSGLVQRLGYVEFDLIADGSSVSTWSNFVANVTTNGAAGTPWMTNATDNSGNSGKFFAEYGITARVNVPLYGLTSTNYWFSFDPLTQLQPTNYTAFGSTRNQVITSQIGTTNLQVLLGTAPEVSYGLGGTSNIHFFTNRFRLTIYGTATAGGSGGGSISVDGSSVSTANFASGWFGQLSVSGSNITIVPKPQSTASSQTFTPDLSTSQSHLFTLTNHATLAAPSNVSTSMIGSVFRLCFLQNTNGGWSLTNVASQYSFGSDITAITLKTNSLKRDYLAVMVRDTNVFDVLGFVRGY